MNHRNLPLIGDLLTRGPEDWLYRGLLFAGPLVVVVIAMVGRSTITVALAMVYIAVHVFTVLYNAFR